MKVFKGGAHSRGVRSRAESQEAADACDVADHLDFTDVYGRFFHEVRRWSRAMGIPHADLDDLAQEVFLVVRRKLDAFDGRNLGGWLFRITQRTASDYRRRAWFRHVFSRQRDTDLDTIEWAGSGPAETLERREAQQQLERLLARMSVKRRTALVLFEIEGYSGEEIAALLEVPVATVWTRLHHARKELLGMVSQLRREEEA